jgi:hypothetical protein
MLSIAPSLTPLAEVDARLATSGCAVLGRVELTGVLTDDAALARWAPYWDELPHDAHLRDSGRYRRRRHGCFIVDHGVATAVLHRAHWQPLDYNALHGGIERWFEPLSEGLVADPAWSRLLVWLADRASALRGPQPWYGEAHTFRIETADGIGRPTPEGAHRDGVDLVAVMLVARRGVRGGETRVFDAKGSRGDRFTLEAPGTLVLLDDARVVHETTPIQPIEPAVLGTRDTLVVTLRASGFQAPPVLSTRSS